MWLDLLEFPLIFNICIVFTSPLNQCQRQSLCMNSVVLGLFWRLSPVFFSSLLFIPCAHMQTPILLVIDQVFCGFYVLIISHRKLMMTRVLCWVLKSSCTASLSFFSHLMCLSWSSAWLLFNLCHLWLLIQLFPTPGHKSAVEFPFPIKCCSYQSVKFSQVLFKWLCVECIVWDVEAQVS